MMFQKINLLPSSDVKEEKILLSWTPQKEPISITEFDLMIYVLLQWNDLYIFNVHNIYHYLHRMREDPGRDNNIDEELLNFQNRESCWT
jgi:hypothetical protein